MISKHKKWTIQHSNSCRMEAADALSCSLTFRFAFLLTLLVVRCCYFE